MPPKSSVKGRDRGVWSMGELGEVTRVVHGKWYEPAFLLAGFGGLRVGESVGVMGSDVSAVETCGQTEELLITLAREELTENGNWISYQRDNKPDFSF